MEAAEYSNKEFLNTNAEEQEKYIEQEAQAEQEKRSEQEEKIGYRQVLSQKEYVKIIVANLINRFGDSIDSIAFTWLVYSITGSAAWSAIIFGINMLPSVVLQPFTGVLVEGMNKKRVMVLSDIVRGIVVVGLVILYLNNLVTPWILVSFTLIISSVEAFCSPASTAIIPKLIEKKYYAFGTSLNSTLSSIVQLIGLAAAGIIISEAGIGAAILIDAVSFFGSAAVLTFLRAKEDNHKKEKWNKEKYQKDLKEGFQYLKVKPVVMNFCIMAVLLNAILVPLNSLQSPLIYEVMGQGSELLSVYSIALMLGMGAGSFLYPYIGAKLSARREVIFAGFALSAGFLILSMGTHFQRYLVAIYAITIFGSFLIGSAASVTMAVLNVQFMKAVEEKYLARVGSIFGAGACAAIPIMSLVIGGISVVCSTAHIFQISAALCAIMFVIIAVKKVRFE